MAPLANQPLEVISDSDWNFGAVPDAELIACCYWEYARESAFIRDVRQRCLKEQEGRGDQDERLHQDLQWVQSIGTDADFFLHGFFRPPEGEFSDVVSRRPGKLHRVTGKFPEPWQSLTKKERDYRASGRPRGKEDFGHIVAFKRGHVLDARQIYQAVTAQRQLRDEVNDRVRRENPKLTEADLCGLGKFYRPDIQPSFIFASGTEKTVVEIGWEHFTNEKIIQAFRQWVKANRPKDMPALDNKGRNKARDLRVALERLAMMRLLHQFRLRELRTAYPKAWKLYGKREWYKERKRAGATFRRLFPFLSRSERPLNWATKGGRSK